MATRSIPEYFVLTTIFNEIKARDAFFNPQTMFDFGSGVGSTLWVAMQTWTNINEYMGIDISNEMNELSKRIIKKSPLKIKDVFHRQYLPVSNLKYDLIVSAYSFMELPNTRQRLEVITKLWKKTRKYLVIVEQGTNNGFKVINEAREFINQINKNIQEKYFIFAPCPHSNKCPRYIENRTPCNFLNQYLPLQFSGFSKHKLEFFSYIVFKKDLILIYLKILGEATENDSWYRVVRNSIIHKNHVQCNLCTSNGQLKQIVFKKKYEKSLYKYAKRTGWGDRLPIEPNFTSNLCSENK
ncbi:PREDICTED: methyltransferase-like protein 17, mitochondrial [Ceratosolen solmsi marchali]|uniref:Methyltransferase-like protein 17, mitochondrial n=1 Tax=Ceratosolen solmsi marchali TaxID=326594 RepID=A0AAJ6YC90_9HYME|nr:PREDICTED: methyltransferase-like protein 17, mitochondrial [Ceratosolen solmsi marchali]